MRLGCVCVIQFRRITIPTIILQVCYLISKFSVGKYFSDIFTIVNGVSIGAYSIDQWYNHLANV